MKAILIDPTTQTVKVIEIEKGIQAIYKALNCDTFECPVELPNRDTFYCDEEGKLTHSEKQTGGFTYKRGWNDVIVGKCLVVGTTSGGNSTDCKSNPEDLLNSKDWGSLVWVNAERTNALLERMGF